MIEEDFWFQCPYCWMDVSIRLEPTAGKSQNFSYDCEVCCRPVRIRVKFEDGEVADFFAEEES